jgi:hypothetical protein
VIRGAKRKQRRRQQRAEESSTRAQREEQQENEADHDRTHRKFIGRALRAGVGGSFRFPPFSDRIKVLAVTEDVVTVMTGDGRQRKFPREVGGRIV